MFRDLFSALYKCVHIDEMAGDWIRCCSSLPDIMQQTAAPGYGIALRTSLLISARLRRCQYEA
jgi:hypothetical protein